MSELLQAASLCWHGRVTDVSLSVAAGELVGIIGANGAGKSSLLKLLAGLRPPDSGDIRFDGDALTQLTPQQRARRLGYLEQRPMLHWPLSVQQVVTLARLPHGDGDTTAGLQAVNAALATTGMQAFAARNFESLSEGEKMRSNLARLLAGQPRVLLADEPTAALDPARQQEVMAILRQQARGGSAVVVTLHELTLAARYCDRLVLLQQGRVLATGSATAVLTPALLAQAYEMDACLDITTATVIIASPRTI
jgi:iron complex transport system ATP-binding protein